MYAMTRLVSVLVMLALLVGAAAPLAAAALPETGMPVDICPMMDHTPQDEPCIGQPCPCHGNGSETSALPDGTRLALPEVESAAPLPATRANVAPSVQRNCQAGFRAAIDHPPHRAA
jgi:hypothetical protein